MAASLTSAFLAQRHSLMWTLMRIVRDRKTAEDLTQETFLRARQAIDAGPIDHIEAFLHQTARNLALDHARRHRRRSRFERTDTTEGELTAVASDEPSPEAIVIQRERLRLLEQALSALPSRAQQVWRLSRLEKWPHARIAAHLGVSPNTVFNDLKLALGHCNDTLKRFDRL